MTLYAQEGNYFSGEFDKDTIEWTSDTIFIDGDLMLKDSAMLTILPGVKVFFNGSFEIKCTGTIRALGSREEPIVFTCADTFGYYRNDLNVGGWKGITLSHNDSSVSQFSYCILEFAKKVTGPYGINGGAIRINRYRQLTIDHCTFRYNKSGFGGALFIEDANPLVSHCKIYENLGMEAGGAIYIYDGQIRLSNSLIAGNNSVNGGGIYFQDSEDATSIFNVTISDNVASNTSGGIYIDKSEQINIRNTIIYDNVQLDDRELYLTSDTLNISVRSCNMRYQASYLPFWNYITQHPSFVKNSVYDYRLDFGSPCIDHGSVIAGDKNNFDIDGRIRVWDGDGDDFAVIDIGAYEFDSPIPPKILYEARHPESFEESNGTIDITVLYGTPPFHFEWNTGDTTEDLHNLKAGLYIVRLTDSYNLKDSLTLVLDYIDQSDYSVTGTVFTDYGFLKDGIVLSFEDNDSSFRFEKGSLVIDGKYHLNGLNHSNYLLFALPSIKSEQNYMPSFYYDDQLWEDSYQYELSGRAFDVDFYLPQPGYLSGMNEISGILRVLDTSYYSEKRELNPWFSYISSISIENHIESASDIPIVILRNGNPYGWTITDTNGYYAFENIPDGDYQLLAQVPGRPMITPPMITLDIEHQEEHSLKMLLREHDIISYLNDNQNNEVSGAIAYPNPVRDILFIDLNLYREIRGVRIDLISCDDRRVKHFIKYKPEELSIIQLDISDISSGIYLIQLEVDNSFKYFKVFKY